MNSTMTRSTTQSRDGTTLAFEATGEGPSIVFVPAAFQHLAIDATGARVAELLAPRFTVYRYDRRGRGGSGDTAPYAVEREIDDLAAILEAAGGSACAFGGSSGAVLALEAAARGVEIARLALYEPPFVVDPGRGALPKDYLRRLDELIAAGRQGDAVEYFLTAAIGMPPAAVSAMGDMPLWPALTSVAHTLAYDSRVMGETMGGDPSALERFAAVAVPTLVIDGGDSPPSMEMAADALAGVLPEVERRTLAGQTHEVAPEALAPALQDFFTRP